MSEDQEKQEHAVQDQHRVRVAQIGIEGETFLKSPLGKSIFTRIDEEMSHLVPELINADPEDAAQQRDIRNEIKIRTMFRAFIMEAIQTGQNAAQQLEDVETPDY